MSSTGQATSSASNFQLIINALADYTKITGIDLSKNPIAATIEQSSSSEAILELLQAREKAFKEYRDGNRRLINCLTPAVNVLQAFSGILGGAVGLVSHTRHLMSLSTEPPSRQVPFPPANALLVGFDVLLAVRSLNMLSNGVLINVPGCKWGFVELRCATRSVRVLGQFPQAS
jgi:fungal STAND N-terminal Goodbye domain